MPACKHLSNIFEECISDFLFIIFAFAKKFYLQNFGKCYKRYFHIQSKNIFSRLVLSQHRSLPCISFIFELFQQYFIMYGFRENARVLDFSFNLGFSSKCIHKKVLSFYFCARKESLMVLYQVKVAINLLITDPFQTWQMFFFGWQSNISRM